jgi:predicted nucleic acid-binding protein
MYCRSSGMIETNESGRCPACESLRRYQRADSRVGSGTPAPRPGDYKTVLSAAAKAGLIGGVVYDALHLHSAQKSGCERIYTFNGRDFSALAPAGLRIRISAP